MDKDKCPKLMKIFDADDNLLYQRHLNQEFPRCSGISPPTLMSCAVCRGEGDIIIICTKGIGILEVEDDKVPIVNISSVCMYYMRVLNMNLFCFGNFQKMCKHLV